MPQSPNWNHYYCEPYKVSIFFFFNKKKGSKSTLIMVEVKFFRYLYPLFKRIYIFHLIPPYLQWTVIFFIFLQYTFLVLYVEKPSAYLTGDTGHNLFHYILSLLFFLPWIFGTQSMNYDSIVFFVFNILSIIFISFFAYCCYKNRYLPSNFIIWCKLYPQFIVPLLSFPLYFRISLSIEFLSNNKDRVNISTFIFYSLSLLLFIFTQFVSSIFFYSFFFFPCSMLDFFDGKTHLTLNAIQMIFAIIFMLFPIWQNVSYLGILFILYIILLFILIYYRICTMVHVTLVGQYFEIGPLFAMPFMFLFHLYGSSHWFYCLIALFFIHICFIIIINIIRKSMKNAAFRVFNSFLYDDSTGVHLPKLVFGNMTSYIRLIAHYNSDPQVLLRFLQNQKQTRLRTSVFIEICRFLAIFPEYRPLMHEEIKNFTSKSIYNQYTLYMFNTFLESIPITTVPESFMNRLDSLYFSYLSHSYFYWNARKNGQYFRAFFESFTCAFYHHECEGEIKGLFHLFPFSPLLHKYYGDMLLNIDGKFEEYKKEIFTSITLGKKPNLFLDPLLHLTSIKNPKILQYCNPEYQSSLNLSESESAMSTVNTSRSDNSHFLFSKAHKKSKKSSIASKIIRSKKRIPYLHYFHFILPPLMVLFFIIYSISINNQKNKMKNEINEVIDHFTRSFYSVFSSILAPFALKNISGNLTNNQQECQSILFSAAVAINHYYSLSPIISYFSNACLIISFHDTNDYVMKSNNVCDVIRNLSSNMTISTIRNIDFMVGQNKVYNDWCDKYRNHNESMFDYFIFLIYGSVFIIAFLIIYFVVACITMNKIMSKNQNAIDFLSSDRRLAPILQNPDSREIFWDQLNGFDSSINFSDSSFHMESESEGDPFSASATIQSNNSNYSISTSTFNQAVASSTRSNRNLSSADQQKKDSTNVSESGMSERISLNRIPKLTFSHPTFSGSNINVKNPQQQRQVTAQSARTISSDNNNVDSIITDSNLSLDSNNNNNNNNITSSSIVNIDLQSNMINLNGSDGNGSDENNNPSMRQKSSGSLHKEIDFDSISVFLDKKKKETCIFSFHSILMILLPWIFLYILVILAYHPLNSHKKIVNNVIDNAKNIEGDFFASILLINEAFNQLTYGKANFSVYSNTNKYFESQGTSLSKDFFLKQCFQFNTLECFSVSSIVLQLMEKNVTENFIVSHAIPLLLAFSEKGIKKLFEVRGFINYSNYLSAGPPFIVLVVLISAIFITNGVFQTKLLSKGLNSLFHFPSFENNNIQPNSNKTSNMNKNDDENINSANVSINVDLNIDVNSKEGDNNNSSAIINVAAPSLKENEKNPRFPTNVIIITSVTETDEIYSISDTCHQIINKKSSEMICKKFSRLFPIVKTSDGFEIRDYNGKAFISKSITIGKISKTALIEASKVEAKNKTTNVIQKLINFMPNYFAKTFSEEFVNFFHFEKSILIFIRIDPNAPQIDNFFTIINRLDQTFYNIDFVRSNGSVLTCICNNPDDLEIILFLRDLITSSEESCKKQMKNLALRSIYIDQIDELNIDIIEGDIEPEVQFEEEKFLNSEAISYLIDEHCIGASEESLFMINSFSKLDKQVKTMFDKTIHTISFKVFSDMIVKNM